MPKARKTRKQKQKTTTRKTVSKQDTIKVSPSTQPVSSSQKQDKSLSNILVVPAHFIVSDLKKTIILSIVFTAITIAVYFNQDQFFSLIQPIL